MKRNVTRRRLLRVGTATSLGALAGCTSRRSFLGRWGHNSDIEAIDQRPSFSLSGPSGERRFGADVSLDGSKAIVGAPESKRVYIFDRGYLGWNQQANFGIDTTKQLDFFGRAVALSGDTAIITGGVTHTDHDYIIPYVFERSNSSWTLTYQIRHFHSEQPVATAYNDGLFFIYGGGWNLPDTVGRLVAYESVDEGWERTLETVGWEAPAKGFTLAADRNRVLIDTYGGAQLYTYEEKSLTSAATLTLPDEGIAVDSTDRWISSLALDGSLAVVGIGREGDVGDSDATPLVAVYERTDGEWQLDDVIDVPAAASLAGRTVTPGVAMAGDLLIVSNVPTGDKRTVQTYERADGAWTHASTFKGKYDLPTTLEQPRQEPGATTANDGTVLIGSPSDTERSEDGATDEDQTAGKVFFYDE
jgi:hypothetical protein